MRLGNNLWESAKFNAGGQITEIGLGNSATDTSFLKLELSYGSATENNGSLREQKISYSGLAQPMIQSYTYDNLNRLKTATETYNGGTVSWKQTFDIDRFGNRKFDLSNTTTPNLSQQSEKVINPLIDTSTNRLVEDQDNDFVKDYEYDAAGNLTKDATGKLFAYNAMRAGLSPRAFTMR